MKKVTMAIAMAALIVFAGCNKNKETEGTTLKASIEQNQGDGSKTSLNPANGAISWSEGDKILVSNGTTSATFPLSSGQATTNGTFTYAGEFDINENTKAVYPETGVITETSVTFTLPEEQDLATPGTFANGANPMVGLYNGDGITFTSVCGVLGISLTGDNIGITAVEIVKDGEMLNGTYTGYFNSPDVDVTNGTNSVRLNCTTTLTAEAKKFYFVLPVGTLGNGFTLNVYGDGADPIFTQTTTTDLTAQANTVKTMNTLEVTTTPVSTVPTGAINGLFTINAAGAQVYFSQGNLQYTKSTGVWSFMEHQYDIVETGAWVNVGTDYANLDVVSLFGWGTSGYNHGAIAYQPWSTSTTSTQYYAYGSYNANLYDGNGQADWGYNAISNGGNQENSGWRTLTIDEWGYLFNSRVTVSDLRYVMATVNGKCGVILLPDNWLTYNYGLNNPNPTDSFSYTDNIIDATNWTTDLESNGAVFLPATGERNGVYFYDSGGIGGGYWSSSRKISNEVYFISFYSDDLDHIITLDNIAAVHSGYSVRLVRNAQ